ncbi:MAG: Gfo/Idh/MocA family oxidoreductase [Bacteroidetes bacterium]|nr:Gfo/Idh/MocA family oxidoreductase [Bacteroidota bacterium]
MIKIGVAGLGHLGRIHLDHLLTMKEFTVTALYDIDKDQLLKISNTHIVQPFTNFEAFLEKCDVVLIATPTLSHFEYAEQAIRHHKHVFIEKPITHTLEEAKKLIDLAQEAGVKVQVGHVERFNPAFTAIKNEAMSPMFIESHRLAQFNVRGTDVSVVLDLMIHDIDIVLSLVNANVKRVHASGVAVASDSIDIANARIEFDNGAVANLTASRISFKKMRKMRLFQHNEYIGIDFLNKSVDLFKLTKDPAIEGIPLSALEPDKKIAMQQPKVIDKNAIREELLAFSKCILNDTEPEINAIEATKALDLAHQVLYQIKRNYQLSD